MLLLLLATLALADEPSGFLGLVPGTEPRAPRSDGACPKGWALSEGVRCCPEATVFEPASRTCVAEPLLGGLRGTLDGDALPWPAAPEPSFGVDVAAVRAHGARDEVRRAVEARSGDLVACLEDTWRERGAFSARVTVALELEPDAVTEADLAFVDTVTLVRPSGVADLDACVLDEVRRWPFPGSTTSVRLTWEVSAR